MRPSPSSSPDVGRAFQRLARVPGVRGAALGLASTDGVRRDEVAFLVYVARKRPLRHVPQHHRLPRTWPVPGGPDLPVDVTEIDEPVAAALGPGGETMGAATPAPGTSAHGPHRPAVTPVYREEVRPIRPGFSFGLAGRTGTLGLVVTHADGPADPLLLSSSHVLNLRADGRVYPLYQPGGVDRPRGSPAVATAARFTRLHPRRPNHTEGGLAVPLEGEAVDATHPLGPVVGMRRRLRPGQRVRKVSRTTGESEGRVVAVDWTGWVRFGRRRYPFARQVLIANEGGAISLDGDSGAVWITDDGEAAAMNFAGCRSGRGSVSTPVSTLLRRLSVRLPTAAEAAQWM